MVETDRILPQNHNGALFMKILYVTTIGLTMEFFVPVIRELLDRGHQVDLACNEEDSPVAEIYRQWACKVFPISCSRSPLDKGNLTAIRQIRELVKVGQYDIVHCHTPLAAASTRLACRKLRKEGTKVYYTAHGFHFFKGAPAKNWLLFYPIEKLCAHFTDVLITINQEDYVLARKKMKAKKIVYVPGVGIDLEKFSKPDINVCVKRQALGIPENAVVLLSVGELSHRKNHQLLLRAASDLENVYIVIAGRGALQEDLSELSAHLGISHRFKLLGYRSDIAELCAMCDIFALPSFQEGLPVALMEAMAAGKTVICSRIRGNTDLMGPKNDLLFDPNSAKDCRRAIQKALTSDRSALGVENTRRIQPFRTGEIVTQMMSLYGLE